MSSVGFDFAVLNKDGHVIKKPNGILKPYQVEIPIAMVLTDKIKLVFLEAESRRREIERQVQAVKPVVNTSIWAALGRFVGGAIRLINENLPDKFQYSQKVLEKIANLCEDSYNKSESEAIYNAQLEKKDLQKQLAFVNDEKSALDYAISSFISLEKKLDYNFPHSKMVFPDDL